MDYVNLLLLGIGLLTLLLVLTAVIFILYCGLLHDVRVTTGSPPIGQFTVVYKFEEGPYKNASYTFTEATSLNPSLNCFGVYYDDPKKVPAEKLRWAVGSIVAENDAKPDPSVVELYTSKGYKVFSFPSIPHAVVSSFPFVSNLSIWLATFRVYPVVGAYVEEKKLCAHPWLEIYRNDKLWIMAVLSDHAEFYVPEAGKPELDSTDL